MPIRKGIKLKFAISSLVTITLLCTIIINGVTSANALKSTLADSYLENNYKYAEKLSSSTSDLLNHMQETINGMASALGHREINQQHLDERLAVVSDYFNSLFILDDEGVIQIISPSVVQFRNEVKAGDKIQSETIKKALATKKPFISEPYYATSGRLIMLISAPIFDKNNHYKGLVAGTIYLESGENAFKRLLGDDRNNDGSYVYVVDQSGKLIYHPDVNRINQDVSANKVVQKVLQGKSGTKQVVNSEGKEFFAGYMYEKNTGWGIVVQTPTSVIEEPLNNLFLKILLQSVPILFLILAMAHLFTKSLTDPLSMLAKFSEDAILHKKDATSLSSIVVKSNIYEVHQLYHQIEQHFQMLNRQIQIDGLTGLANRRTFDKEIKELMDLQIPFTLLMIDIDRFKKVNDTYGHLVGDDTLRFLSDMLTNMVNKDSLCFRYGGEEFSILIKNTSEEYAWGVAERIREEVAMTESPTGHPITISLGISSYRETDQQPEDIIHRADSALFQSKTNGRNRTTIYNENCNVLQS